MAVGGRSSRSVLICLLWSRTVGNGSWRPELWFCIDMFVVVRTVGNGSWRPELSFCIDMFVVVQDGGEWQLEAGALVLY